MRNLALIPARSGSTGLPGKNLLKIDGVSLVGRAIEAAKASGQFEGDGCICVSSDDERILEDGNAHGAMGLPRPPSLAGGEIEVVDVIAQVLGRLGATLGEFDTVCLLNPTSPFREPQDIVECYKLHRKYEPQTTLTITAVKPVVMTHHKRGVRRLWHVSERGHQNRQRRAPTFVQTGSIYIVGVRYFNDTLRLVGERVACLETPKWKSIDIDDQWDYLAACSWATEIKRLKGLIPAESENGRPLESGAGTPETPEETGARLSGEVHPQ